ncbi:DUF2786 domain-containing protein [Streptomyces sp. NPDC020719]|uniref:DUF2786 domain-containing protein n=1 Tax=Streptomyces sp. NPDC020719 TaxID=3154896 RepID=UPI0033DD2F7D
MSNKQHPMLARIRALLTKAEATEFAEEAEQLTAKASELMAKYGIEQTMLSAAKPKQERPTSRLIEITGTYAKDRQQLLSYIGTALGAQTVYTRVRSTTTGHPVLAVDLFGYESDLERIELLFNSLVLQAFNGMKRVRPLYGESTTSYRKTWLAGFSVAIYNRLKSAEETAKADYEETSGTSVALVLADRKSLVIAERDKKYLKLGKTPKRKLSGSGWGAGNAAGKRADIGGPRLDSGRRPALAG